jgi:hypothetical protein
MGLRRKRLPVHIFEWFQPFNIMNYFSKIFYTQEFLVIGIKVYFVSFVCYCLAGFIIVIEGILKCI